MKHKLRKFTSAFLAVIMIFGVLTIAPFTVSATSSVVESAIQWAIAIANDDSHGYSQANRWGPNYDCSSFVISAFKSAGVDTGSATYTGNMRSQFTQHGFVWIPWSQIGGVSNLVRGDILLNEATHTELYLGNSQMVGAHSSKYAQADQISVVGYSNSSNWGGVLRYEENDNYVDLGTDFYAYIMNTDSWKPLVNDGAHNACFNVNVYENQKIWHFIKKPNGSYKIVSLFDNNALDVDLGKNESGTDVGVWTDSDTTNQEWYIYGSSANYYLKPNCSDCVLDMAGGEYYDGVNAQLFTKNNSAAQLFQIWEIDSQSIPVDLGTDFYAHIINTAMWKSLSNNGNHNACFDESLDKNNKVWHFIKKPNGSYKILSLFDNNALDVDLGKNESETDVGVWTDSDTSNQEWYIYGSSAQFYLKPNCSDCVLDMAGGKYYDGVNAQIFTKNGTDAQLFQIWKVDIVGDLSISAIVDDNIVDLNWNPSENAEGYKVKIWNTDSIDDVPYYSCVTTTTHFSEEFSSGNYKVCVYSYNNSSEKASNIISFTIKDNSPSIDINSDSFDISLSSNSYTYDGKAKTPTVTVKNDTATLVKDTDYTVEYTNNTNAGTATVTVTGIGDYTGTLTKTFTINKASQTLNATISSNTINIGGTSRITASGQGAINCSSSNTTVAIVSSSGVVTGISAGTATITVTAAGNSNYNSASKTISITVKKPHLLGDVNGDSDVTIDDVTLIQKYLADISELTNAQKSVADVNSDGDVTIDDVTAIQIYLAGIITKFG